MFDLTASEAAYQEAHIEDDSKLVIIVPSAIALAIAYAAVFLRFVSRRLSRTTIKADDRSVVIGLVNKTSCEIIADCLANLKKVLTTLVVITYYVALGNAMGRHFILVKSREEFMLVSQRSLCA